MRILTYAVIYRHNIFGITIKKKLSLSVYSQYSNNIAVSLSFRYVFKWTVFYVTDRPRDVRIQRTIYTYRYNLIYKRGRNNRTNQIIVNNGKENIHLQQH